MGKLEPRYWFFTFDTGSALFFSLAATQMINGNKKQVKENQERNRLFLIYNIYTCRQNVNDHK